MNRAQREFQNNFSIKKLHQAELSVWCNFCVPKLWRDKESREPRHRASMSIGRLCLLRDRANVMRRTGTAIIAASAFLAVFVAIIPVDALIAIFIAIVVGRYTACRVSKLCDSIGILRDEAPQCRIVGRVTTHDVALHVLCREQNPRMGGLGGDVREQRNPECLDKKHVSLELGDIGHVIDDRPTTKTLDSLVAALIQTGELLLDVGQLGHQTPNNSVVEHLGCLALMRGDGLGEGHGASTVVRNMHVGGSKPTIRASVNAEDGKPVIDDDAPDSRVVHKRPVLVEELQNLCKITVGGEHALVVATVHDIELHKKAS